MSDLEPDPDDVFDVDRIRRLVELMEQHDLREVDLRQAEHRIRLRRGSEAVYPVPTGGAAPAAHVPLPAVDPATPTLPAQSPPAATPSDPAESHMVVIRSPMVGTFYARPNPKAEPYVKVGDIVGPETTVCIIEAMKVFNEIPAEVAGQVVAILLDEEEPVDHGRPLFKIDTRHV